MTRKTFAIKTLVYLTFTVGVIGVVFCVVYNAVYPTDNYIASHRHDENNTAQDRDEVAAIQQPTSEPKNQSAQNEQTAFRVWLGKWSEPMTILTAFLVAGVLVTNVFYYKQWVKMRETVAHVSAQGKTMEDQLAVLRQQAITADRQADIAAKQIKVIVQNERAYMGVRRMRLIGLDESFRTIAVQVTFRNGGKSPAFKFRAYGEVSVGNSPAPFTWRDVPPDIKRAFIPNAEDRSVVIPYGGVVDPDIFISDKTKNQIFIDGEARYETLGGKQVVLCFAGTYVPGEEMFEVRYQYEQ